MFLATHRTRGFTLIEALVYFALTSALIVGTIASAYPLFSNTERSSLAILRDLESAFVFQKIGHLVNGASAIPAPASGTSGTTLTLTVSGDAHSLFLDAGIVVLSVDGATAVPLTASRITITSFTVTREAGAGGRPDTISVTFDANGVAQGPYTRYVRF